MRDKPHARHGCWLVAGLAAALALVEVRDVASQSAPVYLNYRNITVRLGPTMSAEPFANQTTAISLANIINAKSAADPEEHSTPATHVWVSGKPLELEFDFGAEYDLRTLHFWNYTSEDYDVDKIVFTFFDARRTAVGTLEVEPALGGRLGQNPIAAEHYPLSFPANVRYVRAVLTGTNNEVDFNNIGFTANPSLPLAKRPASLTVLSGMRREAKPPANIEIVLDASGSMKELLGKTTRWATALEVLANVVSKLPAESSVGLRTYGHTLSAKDPNTCTDTALLVPVGPIAKTRGPLLAAARALTPRGQTPLVYSILQTPADLKTVGGGTVILITDGEETCKGDFKTVVQSLKSSGLHLRLNIVGFALNSAQARAELGVLAESTGGHYYSASNRDALARALLLAAVDTLPYRVLDAMNKEVARGEAGVTKPHQLAPGRYTVAIAAGDREVRTPVTLAVSRPVVLTAHFKGGDLIVER